MKHTVKICGVEKKTSKKGSTYYIIHFVEKMESIDSVGYKCTSAFADEEIAEQAKVKLNKEAEIAYFWVNGLCRILMMY